MTKFYFPLEKKEITTNNTEHGFLDDYTNQTEIPLLPHPGAFAKKRKHHSHEGVDLYANDGDNVIAIEDGVILDIFQFTGEKVNSPWWNDTYGILVEGNNYTLNYGEIIPRKDLVVGQKIKAGEIIGNIRTVLKVNKGRPMSMLHLEMYKSGTKKTINIWSLGEEKPEELLDPTKLLLHFLTEKT